MLKQPALITLPILLMAWMRSFLSKNRQSLHTQQCWRSSGSPFNTAYTHTSSSKHSYTQIETSCAQECLLEHPLRTSGPLKAYLLGTAMPSGVTWMNSISGLLHNVGEARWHRWKHHKGGLFLLTAQIMLKGFIKEYES